MSERTPHRAAFGLAMLLTILGSCGVSNGLGGYRLRAVPADEVVVPSANRGATELSRAVVVMAEVQVASPTRRPLALMDAVLSFLLIGGGFMLGTRSRHARWFITQVLVANLLFIAVEAVAEVHRLESSRAPIVAAFDAYVASAMPPGTSGTQRSGQEGLVLLRMLEGVLVLATLANLGLHGYALLRTRSETIGQFLDEKPS